MAFDNSSQEELRKYLELIGKQNQERIQRSKNTMDENYVSPEERADARQSAGLKDLFAGLQQSANQIGSLGGQYASANDLQQFATQQNARQAQEMKERDNTFKVAQNDVEAGEKSMLAGLNSQAEMAQRQQIAEQASADRAAALAQTSYDKEEQRKLAERMFKDKQLDRQNALDIARAPEGRLSKLNSADRGNLDKSASALKAVRDMGAALKGGDNTFSLIGDNRFTEAQRRYQEMLGRLQSGGAINKDEEARFAKLAPTWKDSAETQQQKLANLEAMFLDKIHNLGFSPDDLSLVAPNQFAAQPPAGSSASSGFDQGSIQAELARRQSESGKAKLGKNMTKDDADSFLKIQAAKKGK